MKINNAIKISNPSAHLDFFGLGLCDPIPIVTYRR